MQRNQSGRKTTLQDPRIRPDPNWFGKTGFVKLPDRTAVFSPDREFRNEQTIGLSKNRLKQVFRCCSRPILFLVSVCMAIGLLFLVLDSGAGSIFIIATGSGLTAFSLLAARGGFVAELERRLVVSSDR